MPTKKQKQAELRRTTKVSGFRVGMHDFLAEVDFNALKKRNDNFEAKHRNQSILDRKTEELLRVAVYAAIRNSVHHIQIHIHAAHQAGATPEEIYAVIDRLASWSGGETRQIGMEAWRLVFRPDLPSIMRVVKLTSESFNK